MFPHFPLSVFSYYQQDSSCTLLQPVHFTLGHVTLLRDVASLMDVGGKLLIDVKDMEGGSNSDSFRKYILYNREVSGSGPISLSLGLLGREWKLSLM